MGIFKKEPPKPTPTQDSLTSSAFVTSTISILQVFEVRTNPENAGRNLGIENIDKSIALAWVSLQAAALSIFQEKNNFLLSRDLAVRQINLTEVRKVLENNFIEIDTDFLFPEALKKEVIRSFWGIRAQAFQASGFSSIKNPLLGYSPNYSVNASQQDLGRMFVWVPCFLNDFDKDWNADKLCNLDKPHDWVSEKANWKSKPSDNELFTEVISVAHSNYVLDQVRAGESGKDAGGASNWFRVSDKGIELLANGLIHYKQENSCI